MPNPYDLIGDEPSLEEILEEVASWDETNPPAPEASSPFIPLVTPPAKPVPTAPAQPQKIVPKPSYQATMTGAPTVRLPAQKAPAEAPPVQTPPSPDTQKPVEVIAAPETPVAALEKPAVTSEESEAPSAKKPEEAEKPAAPPVQREKKPPVAEHLPEPGENDFTLEEDEESPWLATWANIRVEELWEELRPPGSKLPPRPAPMPELKELKAGKEFGHLTLLPTMKTEPKEDAEAPDETAKEAKPSEAPAQETSKEEEAPAQTESEADEAASEESATETKEAEEKADGEPEAQETAEAPADAAEEASVPVKKSRRSVVDEDGRDNLVPFVTNKEPETIRDALGRLLQQGKVWARLRKDNVAKPLVNIPKPKINFYELPEPAVDEEISAKELARNYSAGLSRLRVQALVSLFFAALLFLAALIDSIELFAFLDPLREGTLLAQISLGIFALLVLLAYPVLFAGIKNLFHLRPGMELLGLLAAAAALTDGVTLLFYDYRPFSLPLFAPAALVLSFQMMGRYWSRHALRMACRTAARSKNPDLLCKEPEQYNGKAIYRRRVGDPTQFAAQVQREDWAQAAFRWLSPLFILLAAAASVWTTVLSGQKELLFWSLTATFSAGATLSGCLCFGLPFHALSVRLSKIGAALAGWAGTKGAERGNYILLKGTDLFPPGAIALSSFMAFNDHDPHKVVSVTASLLREAGSDLDDLFHNMIRMDEGHYVTVTGLEMQKDGMSGKALEETVLVGTANFMERMGVALPPGVRVATGVMTAIGGRFAGRFALEYSMHKTSAGDMDALLSNRITPVLIAVDFNLVPPVLRRLFRFPWEKMAFPALDQRKKLAEAESPDDSQLLGLLTMEGLSALSTVIVGAHRLRRAVKSCTRFSYAGSMLGIFLCAYLSMAGAITALNALNLCVFLILWFVPVALISGWVNQF